MILNYNVDDGDCLTWTLDHGTVDHPCLLKINEILYLP